jgi:tetratricopeptide (TPR) repeat protein
LLHRLIQAEFWNENYAEVGDTLLALAHLHFQRGDQHEALDTLQSVLSLDPLHFEALKQLVSVFTALNESKLSAHHLRQLGETAIARGDLPAAISAFQQLLEHSYHPAFEERLAQVYESQGDLDRALSCFGSLACRYRADEHWQEAARVTQRMAALEPDEPGHREALIALYQRLGLAGQAVEQQLQLARHYQQREQSEPAVFWYQQVLKLEANNLEACQRLAEADPQNVELRERLVKLQELAGDRESVRSGWLQLSNLHTRNGCAEQALSARFHYGELCYHLGDLDLAIEQFQQTRKHPDLELKSYTMLGLCFASKRGLMMLDLAIRQFQKALEVQGRSQQDYLEVRYQLAMVLFENSRAVAALAELRKCYEIDVAFRDVSYWIERVERSLKESERQP